MTGPDQPASPGRVAWLVFWVSAAVLFYEIALMRVLLVSSWHHFAFLVISIALLGFGASGTALTVARPWFMARRRAILLVLAVLTAVAMPLCTAAVQHLPLEARFAPALLWRQMGLWALCWCLLAVPFFFGACAIAGSLMGAGPRIGGVYGANLLGSAVGAMAAPLAMIVIAPAWLASVTAVPALIGGAALLPAARRWWPVPIVVVAAAVMTLWLDPPRIALDPFKYGAHLERLVEQGAARRLATSHGPRGLVEVYRSDALHDLPFLGVGLAPPPLSVVVVDGHHAGSVLDVASADDAAVVDQTLMAFGHDLAPARPRVALLGEVGGRNVWLALRRGATVVDVVQPHRALTSMVREELRDHGGAVLDEPAVRFVAAEPRHFMDHAKGPFDLVQLVGLEGSAAGSGGVGGLGEDHLVTVEGLRSCLARLSDEGVMLACRGIQTPARDNLKLLLTIVQALREGNAARPTEHMVVVRDYLGVCTVVKATPWSPAQVERVRAVCADRQLTPVWFPGIEPEELNHPDELDGPPGEAGDWYHHVIRRAAVEPVATVASEWAFDIRPATDDRPFFHDFCRLRSIGALRAAFGDLWLTRTELAFLFVLVATGLIAVAGAVLTLLPLGLVRRTARSAPPLATAGYFGAIGLAYLMLEITCLSRLSHLIGDPVTTAAVTIAGFLLFSGLGSLHSQRHPARTGAGHRRLLLVLAVAAVAELAILRVVPTVAGGLPLAFRLALALIVIAPLGYLMGFPMPLGLRCLELAAPASVPWAWGVNGFASVLAAPLATALGMTFGFSIAAFAAAACYAAAGLLATRLPREGSPIGSQRVAAPSVSSMRA